MFKDFLNDNLGRTDRPFYPPKSQAKYVEFGYGQVEPNHLSAQRTGQIYAQLPANPEIEILENGQFVKYDYAANDNGIGEVNFDGEGEWMLVFNEIKLYRRHLDGTLQWDCEFAMLKDDYQARIYSPYDYEAPEMEYHDWRRLNGTDELGKTSMTIKTNVTLDVEGKSVTIDGVRIPVTASEPDEDGVITYSMSYEGEDYTTTSKTMTFANVPVVHEYDDVTADVKDIYEMNWTNDPWQRLGIYREKKMPKGTSMVPRVFKTNVGDLFTTNMIDEEELEIGDIVAPRTSDGVLCKAGDTDAMKWQVVKIYTMPDNQKGVKLMRIA